MLLVLKFLRIVLLAWVEKFGRGQLLFSDQFYYWQEQINFIHPLTTSQLYHSPASQLLILLLHHTIIHLIKVATYVN